ncbi:hypothetical protein WOLCODRAFT_133672 [Wolfiporia cocos MD-104 SS10]|uniref:CNH domain-containing protein n=1 Tax=Wolfiporia cocos (strain MD-104) TaxID=742152 RepID=A0A2H3IZU9_WOLCO|nr:hypothetical protein WOLCODRAFT_133672 [Wolfiporia cocos MD-104 SS10]
MTSAAPTNSPEVPKFQLQSLIASVVQSVGRIPGPPIQICCAQALGTEIYVGCSNGDLLRYTTQKDSPESYTLLSRQNVTHDKPIDEIVLLPSLLRALILAEQTVFIYTLPNLDPIPSTVIRPIRNVRLLAVDEQHLRRSPRSDPSQTADPVDFCVIKRSSIVAFSLRDRLVQHQDIPLPTNLSMTLAKRSGSYLCLADQENYNIISLNTAELFQLMPLNQVSEGVPVKPSITVISENEFLILSNMGTHTMGMFITGDGEAVRGMLQWESHPEAICLDYPHIAALLPDATIEIHSIETQQRVQVIPAPPGGDAAALMKLLACTGGFLVPSMQRSEKLRRTPVRLIRKRPTPTEATPEEGICDGVDLI